MPNSETYKIAKCCGAECHGSCEKEPCWGQVDVVGEEFDEEDSYWIHLCEGHINWPGKYILESIKNEI